MNIYTYIPPPLSKVRLGKKKVRSERRVCLGQGRALGTNFLINPKAGAKKCGPNGVCALDKDVSRTRGGGGVHIYIPIWYICKYGMYGMVYMVYMYIYTYVYTIYT